MSAKKRRRLSTPLDAANQQTDEAFVTAYLETGSAGDPKWQTEWKHPKTGEAYQLSLAGSRNLPDADLDACLGLVDETSRRDYETSTKGWHPVKKRKEMQSADLRYILVKDRRGAIGGFTSLMPTYEEGEPVVYCYEIHLKPELQGTGLGALLLGFQSTAAHNMPFVTKVMLTCFRSNARALAFYRKHGFEADDISPGPRILRGKMYQPDYAILSKPSKPTE